MFSKRSNSQRGYSGIIHAAIVSLFAIGCASDGVTISCLDMDWHDIGRRDGIAGEKKTRFEDHAKKCEKENAPINASVYFDGYEKGLLTYCAPEGAFTAGLRGEDFGDACAPGLENAFLSHFLQGRQLRQRTKTADRTEENHRRAKRALERHENSLDTATSRYEDPYLSGGERYAARQDVEYHRREIERYTADIPKLKAQAAEARETLAAFIVILEAEGRTITPADSQQHLAD